MTKRLAKEICEQSMIAAIYIARSCAKAKQKRSSGRLVVRMFRRAIH
jgi:hypothetical protein